MPNFYNVWMPIRNLVLSIFRPIVISIYFTTFYVLFTTQYTAYLKKYVVIWSDKKWIGTSHPLRI